MSKLTISESEIDNLAKRYTKNAEPTLVGVYGRLLNIKQALKYSAGSNLMFGTVAGAATFGALANKWCLLFANEKRIIIAIFKVASVEIKGKQVILKEDIQDIEIKKGLLNWVIKIMLKDGNKLKLKVAKFYLHSQGTHKERVLHLLDNLQTLTNKN